MKPLILSETVAAHFGVKMKTKAKNAGKPTMRQISANRPVIEVLRNEHYATALQAADAHSLILDQVINSASGRQTVYIRDYSTAVGRVTWFIFRFADGTREENKAIDKTQLSVFPKTKISRAAFENLAIGAFQKGVEIENYALEVLEQAALEARLQHMKE